MDKLIEFEQKFDQPNDQWTKSQWRFVALTLLNKNPTLHVKRGRPSKNEAQQKPVQSAEANYQALAHEVIQRMDDRGDKTIKKTVKEIMTESFWRNKKDVDGFTKAELYVGLKLKTTYDAVRKIISSWRKAGK